MGFCNNEFILISVSYSYYEVYTNSQRAFSGLGFTYGSDEDAAFITTWLEVLGLDGIKLLTLKIKELDNTFNASIDPSNINDEFDCHNKSSLMILALSLMKTYYYNQTHHLYLMDLCWH